MAAEFLMYMIDSMKKEFKEKAAEYRALSNQLDKEIANQQKIIENFELLKSLR